MMWIPPPKSPSYLMSVKLVTSILIVGTVVAESDVSGFGSSTRLSIIMFFAIYIL